MILVKYAEVIITPMEQRFSIKKPKSGNLKSLEKSVREVNKALENTPFGLSVNKNLHYLNIIKYKIGCGAPSEILIIARFLIAKGKEKKMQQDSCYIEILLFYSIFFSCYLLQINSSNPFIWVHLCEVLCLYP